MPFLYIIFPEIYLFDLVFFFFFKFISPLFYFFVFLDVLETSFFLRCLGIFSCRFSRFASLTASLCT